MIYLVEAVLFSLQKYWPQFETYDVTILGYKEPQFALPENVAFHSMGYHDPVELWAKDIRTYLEGIPDKHIIYLMDDCPVSGPVDEFLLEYCKALVNNDLTGRIGRVNLTEDASRKYHHVVHNHEDFQLIELDQQAEYRLSTQESIWNKEYMISYLKDEMTPWEFETKNNPKGDGYRILGTKGKYCLDFYHLRRRNDLIRDDWMISDYNRKPLSDQEDHDFITEVLEKG